MPLHFGTGSVSTAMEKAFYCTLLLFTIGSNKKRLALFVFLDLSPNQHVYFMAIFRSSLGVAKHIH
jgi:hypothetical protein